jgi:hypothetical protein
MSTFNDISGLMKYVGREEWAEHLDDVLEEHCGAAMDIFDIEYDDIGGLIGDHWMSNIWGCAFEDLLTRSVGPDQTNIVDVFLRRRGWNEKVQDKIYMKALRVSVMSLYEISDVIPGKSMLMRDLVRGGDPVLVSEGSATQSLKEWDKLAARIVPLAKKSVLAGGALVFSPEAAAAAIDGIQDAIGKRRPTTSVLIDNETLRKAAPLFTSAWLIDILSKSTGKNKPKLQNSAGEDVVFHTIRFPIAARVTQREIGAKLDEIDNLQRESESFWNWLGGPAPDKPAAATAPNAMAWNVTMADGSIVLGNLELKGRFLLLMVNSAGRAAEGRAMLENALAGLVREPLTEIQTVEQMMAARQPREPQEEVPLETATPLVHDLLDKQYRATLDEPVGMLGDISPRAAIRTTRGREKVAQWLKYLENRSANHQNPTDPMATYDFGWLWRELKIENLRK